MSDEPIIVMFPGKGPAIRGTRITIYDVMDYYKQGHAPERIAEYLPVTPKEIQAAIEYIEAHRDEVMPKYQEILAREAVGNPPHIQAMFAKSHEELMAKFERIRRKKQEGKSDARIAG